MELKAKIEGQQDLFGQEETEKVKSAPTVIVSDISEFEDDELQNLERELLGFSLSAKPATQNILWIYCMPSLHHF